jgi:hypothetical protein
LEVTLEESLRHRQELADENRALKSILLRLANEVQSVEFQARCATADLLVVKDKVSSKAKELDEVRCNLHSFLMYVLITDDVQPPILTSLTLFPLSPPIPTTASSIVTSLLLSLRDSLRSLADPEGRITLNDGLTATSLAYARKSVPEAADENEVVAIASLGKQLSANDKERELDRLRHDTEVKKLNGEVERLKSELGGCCFEAAFIVKTAHSSMYRTSRD